MKEAKERVFVQEITYNTISVESLSEMTLIKRQKYQFYDTSAKKSYERKRAKVIEILQNK